MAIAGGSASGPAGGPNVVVVILNWNGAADTAECLRSLQAQTYRSWAAVVVDNGSSDDSVAVLRAGFPSVEIVASPRNLGFAGGCNVGIRRALAGSAEWVLLLNNDTVLDPRCLEELLDSSPALPGVLAPAIYYHDAPERLWSGGARQGWGLPFELKAEDLRRESVAADYVTGCAMLVHRRVFEEIGLLDERFFMYYEDLDFCLRARRAGFGIVVKPRARLWHKVGSSLRHDAPRERYLRMSSALRFYRVELRGWRRLLLPLWVARRLGDAIRQGGWPSAMATLAGVRDGLRPADGSEGAGPHPLGGGGTSSGASACCPGL